MARPIVLSNGELHVGLNEFGLLHDFYYPYVGLENHVIGRGLRHRVGIWIDGAMSWLDDGSWKFEFSYPHASLIGHIQAKSESMQVILEFDDAVDSDMNSFMRNIHIVNQASHPREIRLFMHQAFVIGDSRSNTDTAMYLPDSEAVVHYRGRRVFVVSGRYNDQSFDQYAVGLFGIEGRQGTWMDAEDGELSMSAVEHGRVDSTIRFRVVVGPRSSERVQYWIAAGTSLRSALHVHKKIREQGVLARQNSTAKWWYEWLKPVTNQLEKVPEKYRDVFLNSAMIIKAHTDNRGAVIASTDSAMLNYGRDAYAYSWPRDGAYVLWPLIRLGYQDEALRFFDFCRRGLHPAGYLSHKYRADGALGSSWHSYIHPGGIVAPPIQEDETATVLFVFSQYYHLNKSEKLLKEYYQSFVKPMADFMADYIDPMTNLPKPTFDLWEENFMTTTYTTAVTYGALLAAAELAEDAQDQDSAVAWRAVAEDIHESARSHLYDAESRRFVKGLRYNTESSYEIDKTIDSSSFFGVFMFGLYTPDSSEIQAMVQTLSERFELARYGGLPRYEDDSYRRVEDNSNIWPIATLWLAQYLIEINDEASAKKLIDWVTDRAFNSGAIAEQVIPSSSQPTSIAPLVWSQAEYMATVLDLINQETKTDENN